MVLCQQLEVGFEFGFGVKVEKVLCLLFIRALLHEIDQFCGIIDQNVVHLLSMNYRPEMVGALPTGDGFLLGRLLLGGSSYHGCHLAFEINDGSLVVSADQYLVGVERIKVRHVDAAKGLTIVQENALTRVHVPYDDQVLVLDGHADHSTVQGPVDCGDVSLARGFVFGFDAHVLAVRLVRLYRRHFVGVARGSLLIHKVVLVVGEVGQPVWPEVIDVGVQGEHRLVI